MALQFPAQRELMMEGQAVRLANLPPHRSPGTRRNLPRSAERRTGGSIAPHMQHAPDVLDQRSSIVSHVPPNDVSSARCLTVAVPINHAFARAVFFTCQVQYQATVSRQIPELHAGCTQLIHHPIPNSIASSEDLAVFLIRTAQQGVGDVADHYDARQSRHLFPAVCLVHRGGCTTSIRTPVRRKQWSRAIVCWMHQLWALVSRRTRIFMRPTCALPASWIFSIGNHLIGGDCGPCNNRAEQHCPARNGSIG